MSTLKRDKHREKKRKEKKRKEKKRKEKKRNVQTALSVVTLCLSAYVLLFCAACAQRRTALLFVIFRLICGVVDYECVHHVQAI